LRDGAVKLNWSGRPAIEADVRSSRRECLAWNRTAPIISRSFDRHNGKYNDDKDNLVASIHCECATTSRKDTMRVGVNCGLELLDLDIPEHKLIQRRQQPPAPTLPDPAAAVRNALESPHDFPALRRALTPDDHVAIVVDDHLPHLAQLVVPIVEHVLEAHVALESIVLLQPAGASRDWIHELPGQFQEIAVEVHDPTDRQRLSYLATTRRGRRVYLNRKAVDADQLVVLAPRGYDPLLGYAGPEGILYPVLSNEETRRELSAHLSNEAPGDEAWPVRREAEEVAWLLGAPFMVQVIEGSADGLVHVLGGLAQTSVEGRRLLDARWRFTVDEPADTVVAAVSGTHAGHEFADVAQAMACAARVVKPHGRIILLGGTELALGPGAEVLREADNAAKALASLRREAPADIKSAFQWATAVQQASVYLLSALPPETAEELFTTPFEHAGQVQRLLDQNGSCLFIEDAHKTMAVAAEY
jgi:nickel-dependent lactate racemase